MDTNMASLNTFPDFRFALTLGLTLALAACGGGGSKDGGATTQSVTGGSSADGRVAYAWDFEDADGESTHLYRPLKDGVATTVGTITTCGGGSPNCSVTQVTGKSGKALRFDPTAYSSFAWIPGGSTTSSAFSLCTSNVIEFGDPYGGANSDYRMTVAMWINPDQIDINKTYHLFGTGDPVSSELKAASFHLRIVDGKVRLSLYPGNGFSTAPDLVLDSNTALSAPTPGNNWHHVAATYDNFAVTLFIDGKVDATATRSTDNRALCAAHRPYYLGGLSALVRVDGGPIENASYIFPGVIDQFVFSSRAYSANEILKLAGGVPAK